MITQILKPSTLLLCLCVVFYTTAQTNVIEREWVYFQKRIEVKTDTKVKFKLRGAMKSIVSNSGSASYLWASIEKKNGEDGMFYRVSDTMLQDPKWTTYEIEGYFDASVKAIVFGGGGVSEGKFYYDDFELFFQNEGEPYKKVAISNAGFEKKVIDDTIPGWLQEEREDKTVNKIKGYTFHTSDQHNSGASSLMILGEGVTHDNSYYITPEEGFSPQLGVLISMLNNLSKRVERAVKDLDQRATDFLLDEKANRIGALVMHLAVGEKFYQNLTFENRRFNKEEQEKWQAGLDLGQEGREKFIGKPITYYLDFYKEVRKKTIEELKKRNDAWLAKSWPGARMNNYYAWFHVMEHQSSHLGQILLLKKRVPPEEKPITINKQIED
ncbi:DinB family protein [Aquimarina sp. W85]|uniref:DinB family protein n=1 Tax=Aquimarina rhodophyticola TaxID=3342246 RepID=UPI00366F3385